MGLRGFKSLSNLKRFFFVDLCVLSDSNISAKSTAKYACLAKYSHECLRFSAFNKKFPKIFFI